MTPQELAARLSQLDWSGCSLQHQLAVAAAVETLGGAPRVPVAIYSNVVALVPKGAASRERTVRLLTLDGRHMASQSFSAGLADAPWSWIAEMVAGVAGCALEAVGAAEADAGDFVTVDGIPYCRVVLF